MAQTKTIISADGRKILVDESDDACLPLGFRAGDKTVHKADNGDSIFATIAGLGKSNNGRDVLWYIIDSPGMKGLACYYGTKDPYLPNVGFKLIV